MKLIKFLWKNINIKYSLLLRWMYSQWPVTIKGSKHGYTNHPCNAACVYDNITFFSYLFYWHIFI